MRNRLACSALLACLMAFLFSVPVRAQIHPHHAAQIRKAVQEVKPRVAPKKPRTVLIWNTPPHLMDKDPHKGYCIPYGEEGMRAIGQASGAFQPVAENFQPRHIDPGKTDTGKSFEHGDSIHREQDNQGVIKKVPDIHKHPY